MEAHEVERPIPVIVEEHGDDDDDDDEEEEEEEGGGGGGGGLHHQRSSSFYGRCLSLSCFRRGSVVGSTSSSSSPWQRLGSSHYDDERWWAAPGLRVIRKIRELIAGPKWKTFNRRIRRKGCRTTSTAGGVKFNYDLVNYSLNFDEGPGHHRNLEGDEEEFRRLRSFSVGYGRASGRGREEREGRRGV